MRLQNTKSFAIKQSTFVQHVDTKEPALTTKFPSLFSYKLQSPASCGKHLLTKYIHSTYKMYHGNGYLHAYIADCFGCLRFSKSKLLR